MYKTIHEMKKGKEILKVGIKKRTWKRLLSVTLCGVMTASLFAPMGSGAVRAEENKKTSSTDKIYRLYYDEPAPITGIDNNSRKTDSGFEEHSLPLGNGYMGANIWGGTDTDVIYVTENSLANPYEKNSSNSSNSNRTGLNLLAKTWIDFGHEQAKVKNYERDLILNDATAHVSYDYDGVTYEREYFASYPDKVMAVRLDASETGALDFTLRPEAPYLHPYGETKGDWAGKGKIGEVTASVDESANGENRGTVTLSGSMEYYQINYEGQYKVIAQGGTMETAEGKNGEELVIKDADSAVILLAVGTNYEMTPETFLNGVKEKLDPNVYPHDKVTSYINDAEEKRYDELRQRHVEDYQTYFSRAKIDLGGIDEGKTTDQMLAEYKKGSYSTYLEEVFFQYGRYLLIASSRKGCLPANLQGIWNAYENTPWSGGYWHNVNVQMNYWPAFVTNMPELFESYADFNAAFRKQAEGNADEYLTAIGSEIMAEPGSGENGWAVGTGVYPYTAGSPSAGGHSGPGTGGFTTALFWDWYDFTRDENVLETYTYPAVEGMAKFLSKSLIEKDGKMLISPSASPENANNKQTVGCAFDQQMTWEAYEMLLKSAEILGKDTPIIQTAKDQIDKLDPVNVGYSGQVKEYREEQYYGEFGEYAHRHISQLVGLYPGTSINHNTPAWLDAAKYTLQQRGLGTTGWSIAHRLCLWARVCDGDTCYKEIQQLLKTKIMDNLWDTHPPFQIDGNFGATAGMGEMLLQSHEGYISPLAALPSAWKTGSYAGLLARGNFVVDADWEDGLATEFQITSQSGGSCSVKYPGLANAVVKDANGGIVQVKSEGQDLITFDTQKGQTYTIAAIPKIVEPKAPGSLKAVSVKGGMKLQWEASEDAESYKVYAAVNDASDYELIAENVKDTEYLYLQDEMQEHMTAQDRVTMRVTAVDKNGRESEGATAQMLPLAAPERVQGLWVSEKNLQLNIAEVEGAEKYVVYRQTGEDSWEKVLESAYTTVYIENAQKDSVYGVAAVAQGRESQKTAVEINESGILDNILLNKPVRMVTSQGVHNSFPLSKVVNGKADPTDSSDRVGINGDTKGFWTMEIDLEGSYTLDKLSIVEWKNGEGKTRSKNTKVEVYNSEGQWETVESGFACVWSGTKTIDMKSIHASKIRITFDNQGDPAKYASITEVMCSAKMPQQADKTELFYALQKLDELGLNKYVLSDAVRDAYAAQKEGIEVLRDETASQEAVNSSQKQVEAALKAFTETKSEENIMLGQTAETSTPETSNKYPISALTDGNTDTRFAGKDATSKTLDVTVPLDGTYLITKLYIQEFLEKNDGYKTRGGKTTIEVLTSEGWKKVVENISLKSEPDVDGKPQGTNEMILKKPVLGSAIRYHFENTTYNKQITIYELQAAAMKLPTIVGVTALSEICAELGTPFEKLELPDKVMVQLADGTQQEIPVEWNPDGYDSQKEGKQTLTGTLVIGESLMNPENYTASIQVQVGMTVDEYLNQAIEKAQNLQEKDYTAESWKELQEKLETALALKENPEATEEEKKDAAENLEKAIEKLIPEADKEMLKKAIEEAEKKQKEDYTEESWKTFEEALNKAEDIYGNPNAIQQDVDVALEMLQKAMKALKESVDTEPLKKLIAEAEAEDAEQYTEDSWNRMMIALNEARAVLVDPEMNQEAVNQAYQKLKDALDGLVEQAESETPDASALKESIKKAEGLDRTAYTEDSWSVVQSALDAAREVLKDSKATQTDYDKAQKALEDAMTALQLLSGGNGNMTDDSVGDGTSNSLGAGNQGSQQSAVQTGDWTNMIPALASMLAAAGAIVAVLERRKQKR